MKAQPHLLFLLLTEHVYVAGLELFQMLHFRLDLLTHFILVLHFYTPGKNRKPLVFGRFQGV